MMKKSQVQIVGVLLLTAIILAAASISFFWAQELIKKSNNFNEVLRMENRMFELHKAIKEVANEQTQRTVSFDIREGWIWYKNNQSIVYTANLELPEGKAGNRSLIFGNVSSDAPCLGGGVGVLGADDPGCIIESGSIDIELKYILLNDTSTGNCYGIVLDKGDNVGAGKGSHTVFLKYKQTDTDTTTCSNTTYWRRVEIDIRSNR